MRPRKMHFAVVQASGRGNALWTWNGTYKMIYNVQLEVWKIDRFEWRKEESRIKTQKECLPVNERYNEWWKWFWKILMSFVISQFFFNIFLHHEVLMSDLSRILHHQRHSSCYKILQLKSSINWACMIFRLTIHSSLSFHEIVSKSVSRPWAEPVKY